LRPFRAPAREAPLARASAPTFSVIVPAYEAASFIGDAIESALGQTVKPHELIVCDDGSSDDLEGALAPFGDRITFLRRPHRGVGAARNEAIRTSSGEFVVLLDADDRFEPGRLQALGELASARPDLDMLSTDAYLEVDGRLEGRFYDATVFATEHQRLAILDRCFVAWPALRRSRVLEVGGFDESLVVAGDWDLFIRLILTGSEAGIVAEPLMRYRRRPASLTGNRSRSLHARVAVLEKAGSSSDLRPEERSVLERCLARAAERALLFDARAIATQRTRGSRRRRMRDLPKRHASAVTRLAISLAAFAPPLGAPMLAWKERRVARTRVAALTGAQGDTA
jgi:GT2 family glycosyltransferase